MCEEKTEVKKKKSVQDYIQTIEGYKQFMKRVDEMLDQLDVSRIQKTMECLDWHWAGLYDEDFNPEDRVPTEVEILKLARKILVDAVEKGGGGTGGFEVSCSVYDPYIDEDTGKLAVDDFEHMVHTALCFSVSTARDNW